jgi:protoporphyrinogen IX oxidase
MADYYDWFKAFHIIFVISWMAGIFYLPRLFVYHTKVKIGSEQDGLFQTMERRLLRGIMNPAMIGTYVFGLINAYIYGVEALGFWFHIKMTAVIALTIIHGLLARWRKDFEKGQNKHSEKFYRIFNEVPVIAMIVAVIMVVTKPFE